MAYNISLKGITFVLIAIFPIFWTTHSSDPSILTDFFTPENTLSSNINSTYFTLTKMRGLVSETPTVFTATKATLDEFPAKIGQSVSLALLQWPVGAVNPPHIHSRASELLFLLIESLEVGFVDTIANKLYTQTLHVGDCFVFPKGLVHFQMNLDNQNPGVAVSAFGSADAGTVSIPINIFLSRIDDLVLAKGFKTDVSVIQKIKANLIAS